MRALCARQQCASDPNFSAYHRQNPKRTAYVRSLLEDLCHQAHWLSSFDDPLCSSSSPPEKNCTTVIFRRGALRNKSPGKKVSVSRLGSTLREQICYPLPRSPCTGRSAYPGSTLLVPLLWEPAVRLNSAPRCYYSCSVHKLSKLLFSLCDFNTAYIQ